MELTNDMLQGWNACRHGMNWFNSNQLTTVEDTVVALRSEGNKTAWITWLLSNSLQKDRRLRWAIYAAELVFPVFEIEAPCDDRPRKAIQIAKGYLAGDPIDARNPNIIGHAACEASRVVTFSDAASSAAVSAAYVAYCVSDANAKVAADNARVAVSYAYWSDLSLFTKITNYGLELLAGNE